MNDIRKHNLKQMIRASGGMIDGLVKAIEDGAVRNEKVALALKQHPEFFKGEVDKLIERILPLYDGMDTHAIIATTAFFQTPAGQSFKDVTMATTPQMATILQQWSHDVMVAMNGLN